MNLKPYLFVLVILSSYNCFADDISVQFKPLDDISVQVIARQNGTTLTTPATKENNTCFNKIFNEARKGFSGLIDAQLDDGKQTNFKIWDTKFRAGYVRIGKNRLRVLYEVKEDGTVGLSWLDPTSKASKTGQKIDVHEDDIE